jgi:hypothetical protein
VTPPTEPKPKLRYLRALGPLVAFAAAALLSSRLTSATITAGLALGLVITTAVVVYAYKVSNRPPW